MLVQMFQNRVQSNGQNINYGYEIDIEKTKHLLWLLVKCSLVFYNIY